MAWCAAAPANAAVRRAAPSGPLRRRLAAPGPATDVRYLPRTHCSAALAPESSATFSLKEQRESWQRSVAVFAFEFGAPRKPTSVPEDPRVKLG